MHVIYKPPTILVQSDVDANENLLEALQVILPSFSCPVKSYCYLWKPICRNMCAAGYVRMHAHVCADVCQLY